MNVFPTHTKTHARTNNGKTVVVRYTTGQRGKLDHQHLPVLRRHTATVVHALQRHAVLPHRLLLHLVIGPEAAALAVRHSHAQQCQREGIPARVERLELHLQLLVEQVRRRPPVRRLQHVRVDVVTIRSCMLYRDRGRRRSSGCMSDSHT